MSASAEDVVAFLQELKIARIGQGKIAKCISFHEANFPLNYPLRE